ncbi:cytochrome p450 [Moniliophthora roreri]|nr:cytochrome p450 [Moniliophthora roreri]
MLAGSWLSPPSGYAFIISLTLALLVLAWLLRIGKRESYLPPGPSTLPLIGNIHLFPTKYPQFKFTEWARQYGGIYSLKIGSGTIIVLTSMDSVKKLLDRRNATTASRPLDHVTDMIMKGLFLPLMPNNNLWRVQRKIANTILVPSVIGSYLAIQVCEPRYGPWPLHGTHKLSKELCDHLSRYTFSLMTSILFGKRCPRPRTREITAFYEFQHVWTTLASPETVPPLDKLPFLEYIPEKWAPWKALIREVKRRHRELYFGMLDECEKRMTSDEGATGCFIEDLLNRKEEYGMDKEQVGFFGGTMIEAGAETTSSLLKSFVLFLAASPEAQRKAYEEVHRIVGNQRAPILTDYERLPYLNAVWKELSHMKLRRQRSHLGYIIPEHTTIFPNIYGIFHDPEYFDDPESFRPERYLLTEHGTKPSIDDSAFRADIGFGFGRRVCPGMHLAKNSLALNAMYLIWAFEFKPLQDPETGKDIPVDLFAYEEGLSFTPKSFQCRITPRSSNVVDIIQHQFREATETFVKYERDLAPEDMEWVREMRKGW